VDPTGQYAKHTYFINIHAMEMVAGWTSPATRQLLILAIKITS
jgi:hypothetical protein